MKVKKILFASILAAFFFSFIFISKVSAATTFNATVTADVLFVRSGPGTGYGKVGQLAKGATVKVYEQKNNWYRIGTGKKWATAAYLVKVKVSKASVTTASVKSAPTGCIQAVKEANSYCASIASGCSSFSTTQKCLSANKECEDRQKIALEQCPQ